jgi:hypothetical protein
VRFEVQKAASFGAEELLDALAGELSVEREGWLPVWAKGQALSGVAKAVELGHCELAASVGGRVRVVLDVLEVRGDGHADIGWQALAGHDDNPWYGAGRRIEAAPCWLRVANLREVDLGPDAFETGRKDGGWGDGFPQSAAPLVRWRLGST